MTIEDLTLDTTQSIDIFFDIGDVFRSVVHTPGGGIYHPKRRIDAGGPRYLAGRPVVP